MRQVDIYAEGVRLDLYENESIEIERSVLDVDDLEALKSDFSRAFTVPASSINNKFFKHYYLYELDNSFDARKLVVSNIKIGGLTFLNGRLSLLKVELENKKPVNYHINFTANLVNLKETYKDLTLQDLDFSELDYENTLSQASQYFPFSNNNDETMPIKIPLTANRQLYYNSNGEDVDTEKLVNIANNDVENRGLRYDELKPYIKNSYIFDKIASTFPDVKYSNGIFNQPEFTELHTRLNGGDSDFGAWEVIDMSDFTYPSNNEPFLSINRTKKEYNLSSFNDGNTQLVDSRIFFNLNVFISDGFNEIEYEVEFLKDGLPINNYSKKGFSSEGLFIELEPNSKAVVSFRVRSKNRLNAIFEIVSEFKVGDGTFSGGATLLSLNSVNQDIINTFSISENMPDIKIIDWLSAYFKAFNCVAIPNVNEVKILPLDQFYSSGKVVDVTKYIDFKKEEVRRAEFFNKIDFKFSETDSILMSQFNSNNNYYYGDETIDLSEVEDVVSDKGDYEIELPFENAIPERINDQNNNSLTPIGYISFIDDSLSSFEPELHCCYLNRVDLSGSRIKLIGDGLTLPVRYIFTPSNQINLTSNSTLNPSFAFNFKSEISYYTRFAMTNNLYSKYHSRQINGLFSKQRRDLIYTANLPEFILLQLNLNDIVKVGNRLLRINKYSTDLTNGDSKLELYNAYDVEFFNRALDNYFVDEVNVFVDTENFSYDENNTVIVDLGSGTDWFTVDVGSSGIIILFTFQENETGEKRFARVELKDSNNNHVTNINISQNPNPVFFNNNEIKFNNNNITFNNG